MKSGYTFVKETFEEFDNSYQSPNWVRGVEYRRGLSIKRVEQPTKIHRARELGYRAKQGYIIVRARIRRGGMHKMRPVNGRKPRSLGVNKYTVNKNLRWMAEERAQRKFPNMEVLNSYFVYADGKSKYYEVILVDPSHPVIKSDPKINWICEPQQGNRVNRGLSSAGKKSRGLRRKGWGAEKVRPSINCKKNRRRGK